MSRSGFFHRFFHHDHYGVMSFAKFAWQANIFASSDHAITKRLRRSTTGFTGFDSTGFKPKDKLIKCYRNSKCLSREMSSQDVQISRTSTFKLSITLIPCMVFVQRNLHDPVMDTPRNVHAQYSVDGYNFNFNFFQFLFAAERNCSN